MAELTVKNYSDEEKRKAAYALNLCTVSVSQIIDYNDIAVLEQEYDAILNNLNLREMPKDEALLNVLNQILDTVTFFKIQEGDKRFIEKEYKSKVRSAIWSAIPSPTAFLVVATRPSPVQIASILINLGTAYFNYRKKLAEIKDDREHKDWELQRAAIEQFNGLRRELFDTAWRLSYEYDFPDEYRLTENQITQYNEILLDDDLFRRYERMKAVEEDFKVYPTFWYWLGTTAHAICLEFGEEAEEKEKYKSCAIDAYKKVLDNSFDLLRDDYTYCASALEYVCLKEFADEDRHYVDKAVAKSGRRNDIIELAVIEYLQYEEYDKAANYLKQLINNGYNEIMNAQLLSLIYVHEYLEKRIDNSRNIEFEYRMLTRRVNGKYLVSWPNLDETGKYCKDVDREFLSNQRNILIKKYAHVMNSLIRKYTIQFNKVILLPYSSNQISDEEYLDDNLHRHNRKTCIRKTVLNTRKNAGYISELCSTDSIIKAIDILEDMCFSLFNLVEDRELLKGEILTSIDEKKKDILNLYNSFAGTDFQPSEKDVDTFFENYSFKFFTENLWKKLAEVILKEMNECNCFQDIVDREIGLRQFCDKEDIEYPELVLDLNAEYRPLIEKQEKFIYDVIFDEKARDIINQKEEKKNQIQEMAGVIESQADGLLHDSDRKNNLSLLTGEALTQFWRKLEHKKTAVLKKDNLVAAIDGMKKERTILFFLNGVVITKYKNYIIYPDWVHICPYDKIGFRGNYIKIEQQEGWLNPKRIDINKLDSMIEKLKEKSKTLMPSEETQNSGNAGRFELKAKADEKDGKIKISVE